MLDKIWYYRIFNQVEQSNVIQLGETSYDDLAEYMKISFVFIHQDDFTTGCYTFFPYK